jgi:hypothetical protein
MIISQLGSDFQFFLVSVAVPLFCLSENAWPGLVSVNILEIMVMHSKCMIPEIGLPYRVIRMARTHVTQLS